MNFVHYDTLTLRNVTYGDYETHLRCYEDENEDYNLNDNRDNSGERQPRTADYSNKTGEKGCCDTAAN